MITETNHRASIAITTIKAAGHIDNLTQALLDRIEELEREVDRNAAEIVRLDSIAAVAMRVADIGASIGPEPTMKQAENAIEAVGKIVDVIEREKRP